MVRRRVFPLSTDFGKGRKINVGAGKEYGICEQCGATFQQVYRPKYDNYTLFKKCGKCRLDKGRKEKGLAEKAIIEYTPHPGQQLVHNSPARFKVISAGSRWGKDRCSVMEYVEKFASMLSESRSADMVPAVHGWIIAPNFTLARQVWRELRAYFPRKWVVNTWETDRMMQTVNDGIIEVRSADDPEMLVGVGLDIVLITEAARISRLDEVWTNIENRLMSPGRGPGGKGGLALANSTPRGRNYFYDMYLFGQKDSPNYDPDWESFNFPSYDNPHLNLKDKEYLERIKKRYPERIYRQEILAEFIAEGNSVFPYADLCASYHGPTDPEPDRIYTIGYDPARSVDFSGVIIRDDLGQVVYIRQWTGKPWTAQITEIAHLSRYYNNALVVIDKTGLGETLPEALEKHGVIVEPIHFTNLLKESMINHLAMLIEQKIISYPPHDTLINELKDYQYTVTKTGAIRYSASSSRRHDDLVTGMMLAFKDFNSIVDEVPWVGMFMEIKKKNYLFN